MGRFLLVTHEASTDFYFSLGIKDDSWSYLQ